MSPLDFLPVIGTVLSNVGKRREVASSNRTNLAEDQRVEAVDAQRAAGRAALMRGILNANGYGATMTDEQILAMLSGTRRRTTPGTTPSIFSSLGNAASRAGDLNLLGSANATPTANPTAGGGGLSPMDAYLRMISDPAYRGTERPGVGYSGFGS